MLQFTRTFRKDFTDMQRAMMNKEDPDQLVFLKRKKKCVINLFKYLKKIFFFSCYKAAVGAEIHAVSSSAKPLSAWFAQNGVQECREACGGHGYLAGT